MATVLGIRCLRFFRTQLHLPLAPQDTLWSDSQCVIGWLRSPQPYMPVFVANRFRTIRPHPATIRFVASSDNPADLPSRGVPPSVLATEKKWWQGPNWLSLPAIEWPTSNVTPQPLQDVPSFPTTPSVVFKTKLVALDHPVDNSVLAKLLARVSTLSLAYCESQPGFNVFCRTRASLSYDSKLQLISQPRKWRLRDSGGFDTFSRSTSLHLSRPCSTRGNTLSFVNWTSSSATTVCFGAVDA